MKLIYNLTLLFKLANRSFRYVSSHLWYHLLPVPVSLVHKSLS